MVVTRARIVINYYWKTEDEGDDRVNEGGLARYGCETLGSSKDAEEVLGFAESLDSEKAPAKIVS